VALDSKGNLYISDSQNNRIRRIDTAGTITTFAGTGLKTTAPGSSGVGVTAAGIQDPKQMMIVNDVLYFCDTAHNMIRSIDLKANPLVVKTLAGNIQSKRFGGDGGPATTANLNSPRACSSSPTERWYISDTDNNLVRKVTPDGSSARSPATSTPPPRPPTPDQRHVGLRLAGDADRLPPPTWTGPAGSSPTPPQRLRGRDPRGAHPTDRPRAHHHHRRYGVANGRG